MTLRASARRCAGTFPVAAAEERSGTVSGAGRMSKSTGAFVPAAPSRKKSSRTIISQYFLGSAAVAGLVLGCAWTVYSNIFAAGVYPSMNSAAYEAPVVKRPAAVAARSEAPSFNDVFASLPPPRMLSKPEDTSASIMFNERFAASAPQGEPSRVADASPPVEPAKLAEGRTRLQRSWLSISRRHRGRPRRSPQRQSPPQRRRPVRSEIWRNAPRRR